MADFALSTVLNFGKYSGLSVAAVSKFDPRYLGYMHNNFEWFNLTDEAKAFIAPKIRSDKNASFNRQNAWAWGFGAGAKRCADKEMREKIRIEYAERRAAGQESMMDRFGRIAWAERQGSADKADK